MMASMKDDQIGTQDEKNAVNKAEDDAHDAKPY